MDRCDWGPLPAERFQVWLNLVQAFAVVSARVEEELDAASRLSLAEHEILIRLSFSPGGRLRMYDLADLLLLSKSGVTRVVDRLEHRGLVTRHTSKEDRRVVHARLSEEGARVLRMAQPVLGSAVEAAIARHLTDRDVAALRRALRRVLEGNGAWTKHRCSPSYCRDDEASE